MIPTIRAAAWLAGAVASLLLVAFASLGLVLASAGVFATSRNAWTSELRLAGMTIRVSVPALMRLATLRGFANLLDGREFATRFGKVRLTRDADALLVRCAPCRWQHPQLASSTVQVRSLELGIRRRDDAIDGTLRFDDVVLTYAGRIQPDAIALNWELRPTELARLVAVLGDVVPEASFARMQGSVGARGALALPALTFTLDWDADDLEVGGLGTEALQYGAFRFGCNQRDGTARIVASGDGEKAWLRADAMGAFLPAAVLAAEDQRFALHAGYDRQAIAEILADLNDGGQKRGASTITQQLARTLFTGGERTAARKLRELLYAIEMERTLGKARILELYLNTVDWGPGLCGAKPAARAYFNKAPKHLSAIEAAWLAAVLRNPHAAWSQQFLARRPDRERATQVLMQMRDWPKRERRRFTRQTLAFAVPNAQARGSSNAVVGSAAAAPAAATAPSAGKASRSAWSAPRLRP